MSQPAKQTVSAPKKSGTGISLPTIVIPIALVTGYCIWKFVCGNGSNFEGGTNEGHPLGGNIMGTIYKGGFIVPILMAFAMIVIVFSIERMLTLSAAAGKGNVSDFISRVKAHLGNGNIDAALSECDKQKGSVANVIRATVEKYSEMERDTHLSKDQKVAAIRAEVTEATSLELPILEKNLPILATLTSVGTLTALLGTVSGMIKAFSALATSGTPDAAALSTGISEALINTALGIATSVIAMIMYSFFTTKIDAMTYSIDEAGFSIASTYSVKH